jgi:hypothetical protein
MNTLLSQLAISANDAINDATTDTTYVSGDNEPSLVARLVAPLPDLLVENWSNDLAKGELHVTSAFCHPRPQAHWDSTHCRLTVDYFRGCDEISISTPIIANKPAVIP